jgi:hypothetical protein
MNSIQTKAFLFLMNEAKRNALGEDFAVRTGTTQRSYLCRAILVLNIDGVQYDLSKKDYVVEPGSAASEVLQSCGYFSFGNSVPEKVKSAKEFI